jgi:hypothetical protein
MDLKKGISILIIVLGLGILGYAIDAKYKVTNAQREYNTYYDPLPKTQIEKEKNKLFKKKIYIYEKDIKILFILSSLLIVIGTSTLIIVTTKKK